MMNKQLYKKMVGEVSVPVLAGLAIDAAQNLLEVDDMNDDAMEQILLIEIVTNELKSRKPKAESSRRARQTTAATASGEAE